MNIVIVSGGKAPKEQLLRKYVDDDTLIISADKGADVLYNYNIVPNIIVGDFDSAKFNNIEYFRSKGCEIISYPEEKNFTDTQAAIEKSMEFTPEKVLMFGCTGSRLDHTLANLGLLYKFLKNNIEAYIIDENNIVSLYDKNFKIEGSLGGLFSLQAFGSTVKNLSILKAKYELYNYDLHFGDPRTVSNELLDTEAFITFDEGILILMKSRD